MRLFLLLATLCVSGIANATNFYFSALTGDDSRTSTQAQNPATPWKTLSKLNSYFSSLSAGDSILFKRGETFPGSIVVSKGGSAGNPIKFGAYGSGAKPIISGFNTVTGWTSLGGNIWESNSAVSTLPAVNMVVVNGTNTRMGRFPNTGYLSYEGHTNNTSITDNQLAATPNWTGAEVVMRVAHWVINRAPITSHVGTKINYTSSDVIYDPINNFGYFIQNDVRTLDTQGEWYYDPNTKKLKIYSTSTPTSVQVATVEDLITATSKSYLTFDNLSLQGANNRSFYISFSSNVIIQNCDINYSGYVAIYGYPNAPSLKVLYCNINNSNDTGIDASASDNAVISYNTINNTGIYAGMGKYVAGTYEGVRANGNNGEISYNRIENTGYCGIKFDGNATVVKNNFINYFCFIKDDGAGIYGFPSEGQTSYTQRTIKDNIVINAIGAVGGTNDPNYLPAEGIYLDASASFADITNNTIANCVNLGLFLNNSKNVNSSGNTIYNCAALLRMTKFQNTPVSNNTFNNNKLIGRTASQRILYLSNDYDQAVNYFTGNNNYYARPIDDNVTIIAFADGLGGGYHSLASWKIFSGQDAASKKSPKTITTTNDLRFEYNETSSSKTIQLGATYIDVANVSYPGSITLAPYTSAVLIKNGAGNALPTANAGPDQTAALPLALINLSGSGTDPDGTIASYTWTKISGPTGGTLSNVTSAITTILSLVQGVYEYELKVTDNAGGIGRDTVRITLNGGGNAAPTSNAGADQNITLPTSTASLSGSGNDPDGSISAYLWTKISGPTSGTITNAASAATTVTALVQGTYKFELRVTDNGGAIGRDTIQVTVNSTGGSSAYGGTPRPIPGTIQVEDFDNGGQNVAYNDLTVENEGEEYRPTESVDLQATTESAAYIGWTNPDEWTKYSVNVLSTATYTMTARISAMNSASSFRVEMDGVTIATISVPNTGGYQAWQTVTVPNINLTAGLKTMRIYFITGGFNINSVTFSTLTNQAPTANAGSDQTITLPTTTVSLSGSGADTDGTIASYAWTKISGGAATITSASAASTTVTGLVAGIYKFELRVTDNGGAIARDTMQVTVNASNQAPTSNAGADQVITLPTSTASLGGSGSDADGSISAYLWTKISGPTSGTITNSASASTTVTALVQGVYKFELRVTDNNGSFGRDTIQVTVNPATTSSAYGGTPRPIPGTIQVEDFDNGGQNVAYYDLTAANEGEAYRLTESVDLQATTESAAYIGWTNPAEWTKYSVNVLSTAPYTLTARVSAMNGASSFRVEMDGVTIATISVPNTGGYQAWQTVTVPNINLTAGLKTMRIYFITGGFNINSVTFSSLTNQAPTANAGSDQTITLPTTSVSLSGSGADTDGTIASYAWTKISGGSATITSASAASTTVTGLVAGIYKFELRVTDNGGAVTRDTMQVTVNATNQAPVSDAGPDKIINLPTNSVIITGSGTDNDGTVASYLWTKISGGAATLASANTPRVTITNLVLGVYKFELKVTDNNGAIGRDTVQVTVNPLTNTPYTGTPKPIPGTIEVEDFDNGGQNVAYYDNSTGNSGGFYRPSESVDLQTATEGGAFMGWTIDGEWTKYSVDVTSSGTYSLVARVSTFSTVAKFRVEMDGVTIATISVPNTSGYQNWQNVTISNIPLTAGLKTMRIYMEVGGFNITRVTFNQTSGSGTTTTTTRSTTVQNNEPTVASDEVVSIYPNPTSGQVRVQLDNTIEGFYQVSLFNVFGKQVWKKTLSSNATQLTESININHLMNGVYILEVIAPDQQRKAYKIIKN